MRRSATVLALLLLATLALPLTGTSASCLFDDRPVEERIGEFEYVFKGRVAGLRDEDRTARFEVQEVWRGALGPEIVVFGGPEQDAGFGQTVATSNDRAWTGGATYLVFAQSEPRGLVDNACSPTREWSDDLAAARPVDWTPPESTIVDDNDGPSGIGALGIIGGVVLAIAGLGALMARHRRSAGAA